MTGSLSICETDDNEVVDNETELNNTHPECNESRRHNRLGRAARRRHRKFVDIQQRAEAALRGVADESGALALSANAAVDDGMSLSTDWDSFLPADRSLVRPSVLECRRSLAEIEIDDETHLIGQLGYVPGNWVRVSARAHQVPFLQQFDVLSAVSHNRNVKSNTPLALQLYPLTLRQEFAGGKSEGRRFKSRRRQQQKQDSCASDDGFDQPITENREATGTVCACNELEQGLLIEPFPTMYWVTHPLLRILISKLELEGWGNHLERRLAEQPDAAEQMKSAHERYGRDRFHLLTMNDQDLVRTRRWEPVLRETGVAGIRHWQYIKCLHAHAAQYLSELDRTDIETKYCNIVGKWVMEAVRDLCRPGHPANESHTN